MVANSLLAKQVWRPHPMSFPEDRDDGRGYLRGKSFPQTQSPQMMACRLDGVCGLILYSVRKLWMTFIKTMNGFCFFFFFFTGCKSEKKKTQKNKHSTEIPCGSQGLKKFMAWLSKTEMRWSLQCAIFWQCIFLDAALTVQTEVDGFIFVFLSKSKEI